MMSVESLSRSQIRSLQLLRKRPERYEQGRFLAEGRRAVEQILEHRAIHVEALVMTQEYMDSTNVDLGTKLPDDIPCYSVNASVFDRLTDTETAQGVLAVCRIPDPIPEKKLLGHRGVLLGVDRIQDPGNLGTIVRTAAWFGLAGLVVSAGTVDLLHPKVVRSTAGATGALPWLTSELSAFLDTAGKQGWKIHLMDSGPGSKSYLATEPTGKDILVVGNEAGGISRELHDAGYPSLRIDPVPEAGKVAVESLNASVASAIMMAHFCSRTDEKDS